MYIICNVIIAVSSDNVCRW